jgi:hypothetical protein
MVPKRMRKICKRILTLEFLEEPPYDEFIQLVENEMESEHEFEWA